MGNKSGSHALRVLDTLETDENIKVTPERIREVVVPYGLIMCSDQLHPHDQRFPRGSFSLNTQNAPPALVITARFCPQL